MLRVFPSGHRVPHIQGVFYFKESYIRDIRRVVTPFMQDGIYPTRNFATFGPSVYSRRLPIFYYVELSLSIISISSLSSRELFHALSKYLYFIAWRAVCLRQVKMRLYNILAFRASRVRQFQSETVLPIASIYSCGNCFFIYLFIKSTPSQHDPITWVYYLCYKKKGLIVNLEDTRDKVPAVAVILLKSRVLSIHTRRKKRSFWKETDARPTELVYVYSITSKITLTILSMSNKY